MPAARSCSTSRAASQTAPTAPRKRRRQPGSRAGQQGQHQAAQRAGTEGFLDNAIEPLVTAITPAIAKEAGLDDKAARAEARLAVAVTRGLLLDLLATGDRAGVTEAFERYLHHADH